MAKMFTLAGAALTLSFIAVPANAAEVIYNFSGTVSDVNSDLASVFSVGQSYTGSFAVDDATYVVNNFNVSFPSYSATGSGNVRVVNNGDFGNPSVDVYDSFTLAVGAAGSQVNGFSPGNFVIVYEARHAPPVNNLTDGSLPLDPASVLPFGYANLQFSGFRNVQLRNLSISAVPEPSTWAMMLLGFGAMGVSMRRRRRTHNLLQVA